MKFRLNAEVLASYVNLVSKVVSSKANLPVLSNILIDVKKDTVTFSGTDLEVQITAKAGLSTQEEGKTTVNAKLFSQYINSLPKEESLEIFLEKSILHVTSQSGTATFSVKEADDFPMFEENDMENVFALPKDTVTLMIEKTNFAAAKEDIRPILTGVNIEIEGNYVTMVALDTFRISKISVQIDEPAPVKQQFVVSAFALDNLNRIIRDAFISSTVEKDIVTCKISKTGNFVVFEYGDVTVSTRLIEGDYPEYKHVIPTAYQTQITIDKQKLLDALKRVGVFAQSAVNQRVKMNFEKDQLQMEANLPEMGRVAESMPVAIEGDSLIIWFQLKYLIDILSHIEDEMVLLRAINKTQGGVFVQPSLETFVHLMMPLTPEE